MVKAFFKEVVLKKRVNKMKKVVHKISAGFIT